MSGDAAVADLAARISCGYEVQHLAARVAACSRRVEGVLARFREIQLLDWQSPAGRAYRNSVALQEVALGRARVRLEDALIAVNAYAQEVGPSSSATPVGQYQWPR
jgi:MarR-like DNA-binding transcriptional regulator SgrR of sgrS sRNA